jgi:putative ABC transport system permease protein
VQYRDRDLAGVFVVASTPAYTQTNDIDLTEGRFYNEIDFRSARSVCIIGADVASGLFPVERPIGKQIRVGGHRCEVIGVLDKMGKFLGLVSFDSQVQMPLSTFKNLFGSRRSLSIEVKVGDEESLDRAQDELTGIVRTARRLEPNEEDNFAINRQEAFQTQLGGVKSMIYGIGIFLTALALVVGGIGVMNIMFVSVKERTREIGIRKAMGATRSAILYQFLMESIMICMVGGIIGILLSLGVTYLINTVFTAHLSVGTVVLAFSICAAVGVAFGFIPARSAATANPIDALRYE